MLVYVSLRFIQGRIMLTRKLQSPETTPNKHQISTSDKLAIKIRLKSISALLGQSYDANSQNHLYICNPTNT